MTDSKDASSSWKSAGEKLSDLGATLKSHYDRQRADDAPTKDDVSDAMKKLGNVLQDAADAVRVAAKDPSVKADLKDVGRTLGAALGATAEQVATEVKQAFDKHGKPVTTEPAAQPSPTFHEPAPTQSPVESPVQDTPMAGPAEDQPRPGTPPPPAAPPQVPPGSADPSI